MTKVTLTAKGLENVDKHLIIAQKKLSEFRKAIDNLNKAIGKVTVVSSKTK